MKIFIILLFLFPSILLLNGCGESQEEKIAKINIIENEIYKKTKTLNLTDEDYKVLSIEGDDNEARKIRDGLYVRLMSTFLDRDVRPEIKYKIILFFKRIYDKKITSPPIRIVESTRKIADKEYLNISYNYIRESFFDIHTTLLFYQELASLQGIIFDLQDGKFLGNELCSAVNYNQLEYASALLDFSIGIFDPGKIRCVTGESYRMVLFTGNTLGMRNDSDVKRKLGVCPMSLRRISGKNWGKAVSQRISNWQSNVQRIDRDSINSLEDAKNKIKGTFKNVPLLNPVPASMNDLLDRHNKWAFGGDCSLESNVRFK